MDIDYLLLLQNFREATGGIFNEFLQFMTDVGWSIIPFLVMAGIYWCVDKKKGLYVIFNCYLGAWINGVIKLMACVYRPWIRSSAVKPLESAKATATGYSFPSGHTANGVGVWGGLAVAYRNHKWLRNTLILIVILIGFSRNYLGVHTPQDVIVSTFVGILLLYITYKLLNWVDAAPGRDKWILIASVLMCIFMVLYASLKSYPMDYVDGVLLVDPKKMALDSWGSGGEILGFGIGLFCERRWVKFNVDGTVEEKLARFVVGALIYAVLFFLLMDVCKLFLDPSLAEFSVKMVRALFIVLLFPMWIAKRNKL